MRHGGDLTFGRYVRSFLQDLVHHEPRIGIGFELQRVRFKCDTDISGEHRPRSAVAQLAFAVPIR